SVETCFRTNAGNPSWLVNESLTSFVSDDGSVTLATRVTTFGSASPTADPGYVDLKLVGAGNVTDAHGVDARVGGAVRQDGIVIEQVCAVIACPGGLGAGFLPIASDPVDPVTYLVETN